MSYTIVVGDLHGRSDLFEVALDEIKKYLGSDQGTVVFLGDYVDRGGGSAAIMRRLIAGPSEPNQKWVCLKGNHEEMMSEALKGGPKLPDGKSNVWWEVWIGSGGNQTVYSYGGPIPVDHIKWIDALPLYYEDEFRIYVHAFVADNKRASEQHANEMLWYCYHDNNNLGYYGKHVAHGHTPKMNGPIILTNRSNWDTGANFTNRLVLGVFKDDVPGGPVEQLVIKGS
jgi:serine/threonine protein phosphatase 1